MKRILASLALIAMLVGVQADARSTGVRAIVGAVPAQFWKDPDSTTSPIGNLAANTTVIVLAKDETGTMYRVLAPKTNGQLVEGFVLATEVRLTRVDPALDAEAIAAYEDSIDTSPENPWGLAGSVSGSSVNGLTTTTVSFEARYLWTTWTESILGVNIAWVDGFEGVGPRAAQRLYAPFGFFRPYAHAGYRVADFRDSDTSAVELGGGAQFVYGEGSTFFELGVMYLWNSAFCDCGVTRPDAFVFGGTGGLRF